MSPRTAHRPSRSLGQGLVEFAFVLPFLLALIFGIIELARILYAWLAVQNAARFGVRYAVTGQFDSQYCGDATSYYLSNTIPGLTTTLGVTDDVAFNPISGSADPADDCNVPRGVNNYNQKTEALQDWARLASIRDVAFAGAPAIQYNPDPSISGDYIGYLTNTSDDFNFTRPYRGQPNLSGFFDVMICSTRSGVVIEDNTVTPWFVTGFDNQDLYLYPSVCRAPNPDNPGGAQNYIDDAGGPGDRVRVTVTFRHPLITPFLSSVWPNLRLAAQREGIVEQFRRSREVVLPGGFGAASTRTPTPSPTYTASNTPTPSDTPTATNTATATDTPTASNTPTRTNTPTITPTPSNTATFAPCQYQQGSSGGAGTYFAFEAEEWMGVAAGTGSAAGKTWEGTTAYSGYSGSMAIQALEDTGVNTSLGTNGPRADYTINFLSTGTYYVYVRGRSGPGGGGSDSLHVGLNGSAVTLAGTGLTGFGGSFSWQQRYNGILTTIDVTTAGANTLNLWMREDGVVADRIVVSTNSSLSSGTLDGLANSVGWTAACGAATIPTATATFTPTQTFTPSRTFTPSNTPTITFTPSRTFTPSITPTPSRTFTPSITPTRTPTRTPSNTPTRTNTPPPSNTPTWTFTPSNTPTRTNTVPPSNTPTRTNTFTPSPGPTNTLTPTRTNTPSPSPTKTPCPYPPEHPLYYTCLATPTP